MSGKNIPPKQSCQKFRLLIESGSFVWHHLADLGHNHLETLIDSTIAYT